MIIAVTKFTKGAWIPLIIIPVIVALFKAIKHHYSSVAAGLSVPAEYKPRRMNHTVVVLVGTVHRGVLEALAYAKSLHPDRLLAVTVVSDEEEQERIERTWSGLEIDVPLEIVHSPYRELYAARFSASSTSSMPATPTASSPSCCRSSWSARGGASSSTTRARSC